MTGADYRNGLLEIALVREVPEHKKPRRIAIGGEGHSPVVIEAGAEAQAA